MVVPTELDDLAAYDITCETNSPTALAAKWLADDVQTHRESWAPSQLLATAQQEELIQLRMNNDMYGAPTTLRVPINNLITLGILIDHDPSTTKVFVRGCQEGTHISRTPRWRSTIRNAVIRSVNNARVRSHQDLIRLIQEARSRREQLGRSYSQKSQSATAPLTRMTSLNYILTNSVT